MQMKLLTHGGGNSHNHVSYQCMTRKEKKTTKQNAAFKQTTANRLGCPPVSTATDHLRALQSWFDHYLQWNQSEHPGVKNLRFTTEQVWTPDILLYNR